MDKRGYKLQEFVAHSSNVNCINIGKKKCRLLLTGGDDHKVNLWAIGKPISLMSLCGHTSPVESVAFDSAEVLVVAGASSGMIKLWDLEEAKMVRSVPGHKLNCTAVAFHPFGEFFASGSMDSNLRIWDIRKKECIHTYKGHTRGISTIRFSPDGRWVVSGGLDNVVKIWDLTAGKLLHDFRFHEGHIRAIDFHPLEFLLATGSADKTVKFWDLETFELIGSARPEATGVRSITFHPDGRTLFCGLEDSLKVYSWEPLIRHDAVDIGWSTLGDLCIHEEKVLGCSYYQNSVGVWVADISLIEPYGAGFVPKQNNYMEQKYNLQGSHSAEKVASTIKGSRSMSSDDETKEIKNIYVDSTGGKPVASQTVRSVKSPKVVVPSDAKETRDLSTQKKSPAVGVPPKINGQALSKSFVVPSVVPRDSPGKYSARRESIAATKPSSDNLIKPVHTRRQSNSKVNVGRLSVTDDSGTLTTIKSDLDNSVNPSFKNRLIPQDDTRECSEENRPSIDSAAEKIEKIVSPLTPLTQENHDGALICSKGIASVRIVNGVSVVQGRTRSLVERFEKREGIVGEDDDHTKILSTQVIPVTDKTCVTLKAEPQISGRELDSANDEKTTEDLMQNHDVFLSTLRSRLTKLQVVRHFWERNEIKGAINALRKLPDHSVQADVVSVLIEKMEILNLDVFSCLLPVLMGLLSSKIERHATVTLEMLLKLVGVFGPVIRSTVSAPPAVGVDLHAEQRLECCNQCFIQLQKIQKMLPELVRRGGVLAKYALQLNLILQES